jgi:hypothetical protein
LIYSFATHLRKGSYRSLPHSRSTGGNTNGGNTNASDAIPYENSAIPDEDEDIEDFYRVPLRTPQSSGAGVGGGGSITSFADFVSAPGSGRRSKAGKSSLSRSSNSANGRAEGEEEVLFDDGDGREEENDADDDLKEERASSRSRA